MNGMPLQLQHELDISSYTAKIKYSQKMFRSLVPNYFPCIEKFIFWMMIVSKNLNINMNLSFKRDIINNGYKTKS